VWDQIRVRFTAKTQELWHAGWFRDFDSRSSTLVTSVPPDPAQSAPAFCGVATPDQLKQMRRTLSQFYDESRSRKRPAEGWDDGLAWSSIVLPYLESIWATGDGPLAANVVHTIADRIYASMDRRTVESEPEDKGAPRLGWPGVSCEIWGAHGAFGGEGYGWGAVMPAHIIRSLLGVRETEDVNELGICPNLADSFMTPGKRYGIAGLRCSGAEGLAVEYRVIDGSRVAVSVGLHAGISIQSVLGANKTEKAVQRDGAAWRFEAENHERCILRLG